LEGQKRDKARPAGGLFLVRSPPAYHAARLMRSTPLAMLGPKKGPCAWLRAAFGGAYRQGLNAPLCVIV